MITLDLSEENLSKTHTKIIEKVKGFMFHDLSGKPMMIKDHIVIKWIPKQK